MSLIAVLSNNNTPSAVSVPILIGDLLISTNHGRVNVSLPTFSNGINQFLPPHQTWLPAGMIQKVYVIKNNLAIALAGDVSEMKQFLVACKDFFKYRDANIQNINKCMVEEILPLNLRNCIFCLLLMEIQDSELHELKTTGSTITTLRLLEASIGQGKWETSQTERFGMVKAAASGSGDFIRFIESYEKQTEFEKFDPSYTTVARAAFNAYSFLGELISKELISMETLKKLWGVNYEFILYEKDGFHKLNSTHMLFLMRLDIITKEMSLSPYYCFHNQYYGDVLLITAIEFEAKKINSYYVLPLDLPEALLDQTIFPKVFSLHTTSVCVTFLVLFSDGTRYKNFTYMQSNSPYKNGKPSIELDIDGKGNFRFDMSEEFTALTIDNILKGAGKN